MSTFLEKIADIEFELARTQKNNQTSHHLGLLKATSSTSTQARGPADLNKLSYMDNWARERGSIPSHLAKYPVQCGRVCHQHSPLHPATGGGHTPLLHAPHYHTPTGGCHQPGEGQQCGQ